MAQPDGDFIIRLHNTACPSGLDSVKQVASITRVQHLGVK